MSETGRWRRLPSGRREHAVLADFLEEDPDDYADDLHGPGRRCSVSLVDGTQLPCVVLRRSAPHVVGTVKALRSAYERGSVQLLEVIDRQPPNRVAAHAVAHVAPSPFAPPRDLLARVEGETTMGWTGFVLEMDDSARFAYGSPWAMDFFDRPGGRSFDEVARVHNHSWLDADGTLRSWPRPPPTDAPWLEQAFAVHLPRPAFTCFVDEA